jgi:hypothetical protein
VEEIRSLYSCWVQQGGVGHYGYQEMILFFVKTRPKSFLQVLFRELTVFGCGARLQRNEDEARVVIVAWRHLGVFGF